MPKGIKLPVTPPPFIPEDDDIVLDSMFASRACGLSRWSLCDLIRGGRGPRVVKFGSKKIGIRAGDLRTWIRSRMVPVE